VELTNALWVTLALWVTRAVFVFRRMWRSGWIPAAQQWMQRVFLPLRLAR
jgi:hypothetical protein